MDAFTDIDSYKCIFMHLPQTLIHYKVWMHSTDLIDSYKVWMHLQTLILIKYGCIYRH